MIFNAELKKSRNVIKSELAGFKRVVYYCVGLRRVSDWVNGVHKLITRVTTESGERAVNKRLHPICDWTLNWSHKQEFLLGMGHRIIHIALCLCEGNSFNHKINKLPQQVLLKGFYPLFPKYSYHKYKSFPVPLLLWILLSLTCINPLDSHQITDWDVWVITFHPVKPPPIFIFRLGGRGEETPKV